jgi:hypothetical protein
MGMRTFLYGSHFSTSSSSGPGSCLASTIAKWLSGDATTTTRLVPSSPGRDRKEEAGAGVTAAEDLHPTAAVIC